MENEQIDPKEKKKLLDDLHTWLYFLDDQDDIDMIYQLTDMKTDWEFEKEKNEPGDEAI